MSYRFCLPLLITALVGLSARAQTTMPDRSHPTSLRTEVMGIGFFGGPAGGLGISFRHHLRSPFSYQVTGGIIKVDQRLMYDFGVEPQFDFSRGADTRFYIAGALSYFYAGTSGNNEMKGPARVGLGGGGELSFGPSLGVTLEVLFTYFTDGTVLPLPQAGLYYYF